MTLVLTRSFDHIVYVKIRPFRIPSWRSEKKTTLCFRSTVLSDNSKFNIKLKLVQSPKWVNIFV